MKHTLKYTLGLAAVMSVILTSCLKDKGFDSGTYGINGISSEIIGISAGTKSFVAVAVDFVNTSQTVDLSGIVFESGNAAKTDINVTTDTLTSGANGLVTKWNAANPSNQLTPLPPAVFQIVNKVVKIPSGQNVGTLQLRIPNATLLSTSLTYGVGIILVSNDANFPFATNFKQALFTVSAKNKYDGRYRLTMYSAGWEAYGIGSQASDVYPADIGLVTAGSNAVTLGHFPPSGFGDLQPGWTGGVGSITGGTAFGATSPRYTFDLATDRLTSVVNTQPDDGRGRTLFLDPASTTSGFDPSSRRVYAEYFMTQNGRPNQTFRMTYAYLGPR